MMVKIKLKKNKVAAKTILQVSLFYLQFSLTLPTVGYSFIFYEVFCEIFLKNQIDHVQQQKCYPSMRLL